MIPLERADALAEQLRDILAPACQRVQIAGSVRRRAPQVKDLELVAVSRLERVTARAGLFEDVEGEVDHLEDAVADGIRDGWLAVRDVEVRRQDGSVEHSSRMGPRYKALVYRGAPVDLFVVRPPAEWGVVLAIRTGPAAYSEALVTRAHARLMRVEGGRLLRMGRPVPTPEEADLFRELGEPMPEPWERAA